MRKFSDAAILKTTAIFFVVVLTVLGIMDQDYLSSFMEDYPSVILMGGVVTIMIICLIPAEKQSEIPKE